MSIDMYGRNRSVGRATQPAGAGRAASAGDPGQAPPGPPARSSDSGLAIGCLAVCLVLLLLATAFVTQRQGLGVGTLALIGLMVLCVWLLVTVSRGASRPSQPPAGAPAQTGPPQPLAPALPPDLLDRLNRLEREAAELRAIVSQYVAPLPPLLPVAPGEATPSEEAASLREAVPPAETAPFGETALEPPSSAPPPPPPVPRPRPPRPATPAYDWAALWRSIAGPLADGKGGEAGPSGAAMTEARIGMVWFSRVGVLLLIAGAILGYRYGVTNNVLRVVTGYVAGLALLALGFWGQRRRYRIWALAVTGGGLAVLFLTTVAASMFFHPAVIPDPVAFGLMVLVTALGTGLAIYHDSPVIGILGMVGGFAASVPLATGPYGFRLLFAYVAILDAGLLLVAYFKRWLLYNFLLFAATWGIYGLWRTVAGRYPLTLAAQAPWAFLFITLFFLIFAAVTVTSSLAPRVRTRTLGAAGQDPPGIPARGAPGTPAQDLALVVANAFVYFGAGLNLLRPAFSLVGGLLALSLAALYLGLGYLVWAKRREDRTLVLGLLGLAAVFLTVAFPVALNGPWITVAWALEGAVLVWLGFLAGAREARWGGLAVLALAAVRLCAWETFPASFGGLLPGPALRALTFLASVAAFYVAAVAYARHKGRRDVLGALVVAANVFTLWYLTFEVCLHFKQAWYATVLGVGTGGLSGPVAPVAGLVALTLSALWGLYGLGVSLADLRFGQKAVRAGARLVLGLALTFLVAGGLMTADLAVAPVTRYLALGGVLGSVWAAELVIRRRGLEPGVNGALSLAATAVAFGAVALETMRFLAPVLTPAIGQLETWELWRWQASVRVFALAAAWGAYALLVAAAGAWLRSAGAKIASGACFLVAIVMVAFAGVPNPAAATSLRAIAFAALAPGTYLAAYLAAYVAARGSRARGATPAGWPRVEALTWVAATLAASLLTAWWGASEIRTLVLPYREIWGLGAPDFAALTWLGLYALGVGLAGRWLRSAPARWLAIGLQGLSLAGLMLAVGFARAWWPFKGAAFAAIVLGLYAANLLFRAPDRKVSEARAVGGLSLVACAFTAAWLALEVHLRFAPAGFVPETVWLAARSTANHWAVLLGGLYGLAVTVLGIRLRSPATRAVGLAIQSLTAAAAFTVGLSNLAAPHALRLVALIGSLGGLYASAWLVRRFAARTTNLDRRATEWLCLAGAAATVVWLTAQARQYFIPFITAGTQLEREFARSTLDFSVSAVWAAYGFVVLVAGFVLRHRFTRLLGLGVLGLTLGKIGLSDMWHLAVRWRILITIGLGVVFVVASFIYQRFSRIVLGPGPEAPGGARPGRAPGGKRGKARGAGPMAVLIIVVVTAAASLLLPAGPALAALDAAEWKYARRVGEGPAGWAVVELDGPVFAGARPDLADLRVVDEAKNEIPWKEVPRAGESAERFEVRVFDLFVDQRAGRTTFVADLGQSGVVTNRIVLETASRDFFKRLTFEASSGLDAWNPLAAEDYVYDLSTKGGGTRLDASYPETSCRYLRVTIEDLGTPPLQALGAELVRLAPAPAAEREVPGSVLARSQEGNDTWTTIDLGYAGIPASQVRVTTSATFFRRPLVLEGSADRADWTVVARGTIYRYGAGGISGAAGAGGAAEGAAELRVSFAEATYRFYRVTIKSGDDPAITPERLALAGLPRRILFKRPGARQLFLLYGNAGATAPRYDPTQFTEPTAANPVPASLGRQLTVITEPETAAPPEKPAKSPADPRLWRYERPVQAPATAAGSGGFVAIGLDRWVIGAARPDLGDLRLADDLGLDVPYQVHSDLTTAATTWTFALANAGKEPDSAWWVLDLGAPNTPSQFVRFEATGSSAARSVTVAGSNDGQAWSPAGQGTVRRVETIFGLEENLVVSYPVARYRYLRVEVAGQDVLFKPAEVKGYSPAIVFCPQAGRSYRLFYGNPAAPAPAYAPVLFVDAYAAALLGPEALGAITDHNPPPGRPDFLVPGEGGAATGPASGWARYGLWIVLGFAVPVLGYLAFAVFRKVMAREEGESDGD